ncbi:MAG: type II secretion system protein [Chthoniobacterales bacterium]
MFSQARYSDHRRAFTLVEMLVTLAIIIILSGLLIGNFEHLWNSVARARCTSNLRFLHGAFNSYTQDNNYWPQLPPDLPKIGRVYEQWWIDTMKPYGVGEEAWLCPSTKKQAAAAPEKERLLIHYSPTQFDAFRRRPYQWSAMPWLVEVGGPHPGGALMIFPDGSVRQINDFMPASN